MGPLHDEYGQMWGVTTFLDVTPNGMTVRIAFAQREAVLQLEEAGYLFCLRGNYHPVEKPSAPASANPGTIST